MMQQQMLQQPGVVVMPSTGPMPTIQPGQPGAYGARPVAWEYPLKGLGHFCTHPGLWLYALCPVVCSLFALLISFGLVIATFDAQHDFIVARGWYSGGWAWLVTLLLCLAELAVATVALLQTALMCIMRNVFIETMKHKGVWQGENDKFNIMDELFWVVVNVATAICTLWMHFVPVVGTLLYCAINGALMAWEYHEIYFNMIGIGKRAQRHEVCAHKGDYLTFGMVSQLLLFVPFVGPATFITSVCGAALWAAELEVRGCRPAGGIAQPQQLQAAPMRPDGMGGAPMIVQQPMMPMPAAPMIVQQPMMPVPAAAQLVQPQVAEAYVVASAPPAEFVGKN